MENNKIIFRTNYTKNLKTAVNCSNVYEKQYVEILPFTKDENGKFLNDTSNSIFKENGKINIQEQIDSYRDSVDIYKIIDKYQASGDISLLDRKKGFFVDISGFPDDSNILSEIDNLLTKKQQEAAAAALKSKDNQTEPEVQKDDKKESDK